MKIQYLSDLHMEFGGRDTKGYPTSGDVLILAGDIHTSNKITKILKRFCSHFKCPVIFVPGNHEYYGSSKIAVDKKLRELNLPNLYVLNPGHVVIDKVLFIGSTGWIDGSFKPINKAEYPSYNDFFQIKEFEQSHLQWGKKDKSYIEDCLKDKKTGKIKADKTIVITHFIPLVECIHPKYKHSEYNPCFSNNWRELLNKYHIDYWIFGHSHLTFEKVVSNCKFLSNPFGYKKYEENKEFKIDKTIEI